MSDTESLRQEVADLSKRIELLEENISRVQPWLITMYEDMLDMHKASAAKLRGDNDAARKLVENVMKNYGILAGKASGDE
jgi:predicted  nucleic acid-binding Zn-ribbon protein